MPRSLSPPPSLTFHLFPLLFPRSLSTRILPPLPFRSRLLSSCSLGASAYTSKAPPRGLWNPIGSGLSPTSVRANRIADAHTTHHRAARSRARTGRVEHLALDRSAASHAPTPTPTHAAPAARTAREPTGLPPAPSGPVPDTCPRPSRIPHTSPSRNSRSPPRGPPALSCSSTVLRPLASPSEPPRPPPSNRPALRSGRVRDAPPSRHRRTHLEN